MCVCVHDPVRPTSQLSASRAEHCTLHTAAKEKEPPAHINGPRNMCTHIGVDGTMRAKVELPIMLRKFSHFQASENGHEEKSAERSGILPTLLAAIIFYY